MIIKNFDTNDIVGMTEISERTGLATNRLFNWTRRYAFPEPICTIRQGRLWYWPHVRDYLKQHDLLPDGVV